MTTTGIGAGTSVGQGAGVPSSGQKGNDKGLNALFSDMLASMVGASFMPMQTHVGKSGTGHGESANAKAVGQSPTSGSVKTGKLSVDSKMEALVHATALGASQSKMDVKSEQMSLLTKLAGHPANEDSKSATNATTVLDLPSKMPIANPSVAKLHAASLLQLANESGQARPLNMTQMSQNQVLSAQQSSEKHAGHLGKGAESTVKSPQKPEVSLPVFSANAGAVTLPVADNVTKTTTSSSQVDVRDPKALSQFGQLISAKVNAGQTELRVQIHPQGMGQLDVTVTKSDSGMQIQLVASQASTFEWLNGQMPSLQQAIQQAGVQVAGMQLSFGQNQDQSGSERGNKSTKQQKGSMAIATKEMGQSFAAISEHVARHSGDISLSV